jgi:hypothetical protein
MSVKQCSTEWPSLRILSTRPIRATTTVNNILDASSLYHGVIKIINSNATKAAGEVIIRELCNHIINCHYTAGDNTYDNMTYTVPGR